MKHTLHRSAVIALALLCAAPLHAAPVDAIGTVAIGRYVCERPGNALGQVGIHQPEVDFEILNASAYQSEVGSGSYLRVGEVVSFTSGPRRGEQFRWISANFLRRLNPDGSLSSLRCIRRNRNNS